jgi:hypothetical protein
MKTESFIRVLAGSVILLSILLVLTVSPWWLVLTGFVAVNLIQSAFTGFCPPTWFLRRLGWIRADGTITWGAQPHPQTVQ